MHQILGKDPVPWNYCLELTKRRRIMKTVWARAVPESLQILSPRDLDTDSLYTERELAAQAVITSLINIIK